MPLQTTNFKAKKNTLGILYEHLKTHGLATSVTYEEYASKVENPVPRRTIKKLFMGRWVRAMNSVKKVYPDVDVIINKIKDPTPKTAPKAKKDPLEALSKAASAEKMSDDDE